MFEIPTMEVQVDPDVTVLSEILAGPSRPSATFKVHAEQHGVLGFVYDAEREVGFGEVDFAIILPS